MGYYRSAMAAGVILHEMGIAGSDVVAQIRDRRPGALSIETFASYPEFLK